MLAVALAAVLVTGWFRFHSDSIRRPLGGDEAITLQNYTWAGVTREGEMRDLRRTNDIYTLPSPSPKQLAIGVYASLGRWTEPNNHILNSLLINFTLLLPEKSERTIRLPALTGALMFSVILFWLSGRALGLAWGAPIVFLLSLSYPYIVDFSVEARGYSLMLALQAAIMLSAYAVAGRPASIARGTVCATLATASILNVVSSAIDLVLPVYLALLVSPPPANSGPSGKPGCSATLRRNLLVQGLSVGAISFVFMMDRLPAVISSAGQYGLAFSDGAALVGLLRATWRFLFPGWGWGVFAFTGAAGLLFSLRSSQARFVGVAGLFTWGLTLTHFVVTGRFGYPRTCGHLILFVFLGVAVVIESTICRIGPVGARRAGWAAVALLALLVTLFPRRGANEGEALYRIMSRLRAEPADSMMKTRVLITPEVDGGASKMLPAKWIEAGDSSLVQGPLRLCFLLRQREEAVVRLHALDRTRQQWMPETWTEGEAGATVETFRYIFVTGEVRAFPEGLRGHDRVLVFWRPEFLRLPNVVTPMLEAIEQTGARFLVQDRRVQVKMQVFGRIAEVIFVAEGPDECARIASVVETQLKKYGGTAEVFVPATKSKQPSPTP